MRARSCVVVVVVVAACRKDEETDDCDRVTVITSWIYNRGMWRRGRGILDWLDWLVGWADVCVCVLKESRV